MTATLHDRRRILVVGAGGAGRSTLARRLGAITGLPVIHLDRCYWQPRPRVPAALASVGPEVAVIRLRSRRAVRELLGSVSGATRSTQA